MTDAPPQVVAVSISESPDMAALGLGDEHLQAAMCEIAVHLLADGADISYGGDLRPSGFTELLFELLRRYRRRACAREEARVINYLAWPVHISMATDDLYGIVSELGRHAQVALIGRNGRRMPVEERMGMPSHDPDKREWSAGLTAMRKAMRAETSARVVLGGRVEGYKGDMPGVAEEVQLSIESGQPVFLIGGFGGCAGDIAETLGLADAWEGSRPGSAWPGRQKFEGYGHDSLKNGLSREENEVLARTPHVSHAVTLVLRGLRRLRAGRSAPV